MTTTMSPLRFASTPNSDQRHF